ncbi:hypothetical protein [Kitasatospora sp. NPDC092286]|uniref:hypothetical protein n=1 Tax=Kitasatospora sp. NPDC092286 TaxID=3364087 RepID=UPI0037FD32D2
MLRRPLEPKKSPAHDHPAHEPPAHEIPAHGSPALEAPDLTAARAALARRQEALLAALVAGGPVPPGFDEAQVRAQSIGLAAKRRDTAAKVAPALPRLLGPQYGPLFLAYARRHPQTGGYRADARAFAAWAIADDATGEEHRTALRQWLDPAAGRRPGPLTRLRRALLPGPRPHDQKRPAGSAGPSHEL